VTFSWNAPVTKRSPRAINYAYDDGRGHASTTPNTSVGIDEPRDGGSTTLRVHSVDGNGETSGDLSVPCPDAKNPSVALSQGAHCGPDCGLRGSNRCTNRSCAWIHVTLSNFSPNQQVTCSFDSNAPGPPFPNRTVTADGNGNASVDTSDFFGYPGRQVWASCVGVQSSHCTWPSS
jgi:hypothetical protein